MIQMLIGLLTLDSGKKGNTKAQCLLGEMYENGLGLPDKDPEAALALYKRAMNGKEGPFPVSMRLVYCYLFRPSSYKHQF